MWVCASLIFYFSKNKPLKSQRPWTKNRTNVFCPDSSCGPRRALFFVSQEVVRRKLRNRLSAAWLAYLHASCVGYFFYCPQGAAQAPQAELARRTPPPNHGGARADGACSIAAGMPHRIGSRDAPRWSATVPAGPATAASRSRDAFDSLAHNSRAWILPCGQSPRASLPQSACSERLWSPLCGGSERRDLACR